MLTLRQDLRYAMRVLARMPGFTAVAVMTLALGIGATTTIFSLADAVLVRPLPYADPERLVAIWGRTARDAICEASPAEFVEWKARNTVFVDMASYMYRRAFDLTGAGEPDRVVGRRVTANFFSVLGVDAARGRLFADGEDRPEAEPVAVISHGSWVRRFGADPGMIGREVVLDGGSHVVVGVAPRGFDFAGSTEVWVPLVLSPDEWADRGNFMLQVLGRLEPGVVMRQARSEMDLIADRLARDFPETNARRGIQPMPLRDQLTGGVDRSFLGLLAAAGCVLLIACANVANLVLLRGAGRRPEIAVRVALGAGRPRLMRQLLTEHALLAVLGGVLGLLMALWSFEFVSRLIPEGMGGVVALGLNYRVLTFAALLSLSTGLVFGLVPAVPASRPDLSAALHAGGPRSGAVGASRIIRHALVVSEIALAIVLLIAAGLMTRTLAQLRDVDPGFRADDALVLRMSLRPDRYRELPRRTNLYDQVLERVLALPGVESAAWTTVVPVTPYGGSPPLTIEGRAQPGAGERPEALFRVISSGYQRTLGIALRRGRLFDEHDTAQAPPVVIINETMARRFWGDQDPVGRRIRIGREDSGNPWLTIVGVVGDVMQRALTVAPRPEMVVPYRQYTGGPYSYYHPKYLVVRVAADPTGLVAALREEIWAIDPDLPIAALGTMNDVVEARLYDRRTQRLLLGAFATLALGLAILGIYGVLSYAVAQRTFEIGVRRVLGARGADMIKLVVTEGLGLALIGVGLGTAAAFAVTRWISGMLYGVQPGDPLTFVTVSLIMIGAALTASFIPARRAARVDPIVALRQE